MRALWRSSSLAAAVALVGVASLARDARAHGSGVSGASGMQGASCEMCHTGNGHAMRPTVMLVGPTTLAAGDTATFELDVVSSASLKTHGIDVAASGGALGVVSGQPVATRLESGEITHSAPSSGSTMSQWKLRFTAPAAAGTVTLFGAGLSGDGDGTTFGDTSSQTTLAVQVTAPPDMAGADLGNVDGALASPDLGEPPVDAISSASADLLGKRDLGGKANEARWGCDCTVANASSRRAPAGPLVAAALVALSLLRSRRRRRARRA